MGGGIWAVLGCGCGVVSFFFLVLYVKSPWIVYALVHRALVFFFFFFFICCGVFVYGCELNGIALSFVWCICACVVADVQDAARAAGALPAVIQALETHKGNQAVAYWGCYAVGTLAAGNPANQVPRAL